MTDEEIIDELVSILRRPCDRETERDRYCSVQIYLSLVSWMSPNEVALGTPLCGGPDPQSGQVLVYDDAKGHDLIIKSFGGDRDAEAELLKIAARYVDLGCALPPNLRNFTSGFLYSWSMSPGNPEGADKYTNFTRNLSIVAGLLHLRDRRGIKNKAQANRLVRKALEKIGIHISEDGVKQIWRRCDVDEATIAALILR